MIVMNAEEVSERIKDKLSKVLKKKAEKTVSIQRDKEKWTAKVEVLEEVYLPGQPEIMSMNDIIGLYDVQMSGKGELLGWKRLETRQRGKTSEGP